MGKPDPGFESRRSRIIENHTGAWGSSSQDFVHLATMLYGESAKYAKNSDGNCSIYTLAGIPMLFSALRCLLIELNSGMFATNCNETNLINLADAKNDASGIEQCYPEFPLELRKQLKLLLDVRHEIVHPAHRPGLERNNTPTYLAQLRDSGLLQSTGNETDYIWLNQIQSHNLFRWAFGILKNTVEQLLRIHNVPAYAANGLIETYSKHETIDADLK